jgi:nicotinate phosphoribosyltransferase
VGAVGTSNVAAGRLYDIPVFGTMAHSYIQAHADEMNAFATFAQEFPETTLLVDTYDTLAGVHKVIQLAQQLGDAFKVSAIRLDSGDLAELAKESRRLLDEAGLNRVKIIASSSLDEYKIKKLLAQGAPIDSFGVGTELAVSGDAPDIDFAYKLVEYAYQPRMKLSSSKINRPGRKQVFRRFENGQMTGDVIARFHEKIAGEALLQPVMKNGRRLAGQVSLASARDYAQRQLRTLPARLKDLNPVDPGYPVAISDELEKTTTALQDTLQQQMINQ